MHRPTTTLAERVGLRRRAITLLSITQALATTHRTLTEQQAALERVRRELGSWPRENVVLNTLRQKQLTTSVARLTHLRRQLLTVYRFAVRLADRRHMEPDGDLWDHLALLTLTYPTLYTALRQLEAEGMPERAEVAEPWGAFPGSMLFPAPLGRDFIAA